MHRREFLRGAVGTALTYPCCHTCAIAGSALGCRAAFNTGEFFYGRTQSISGLGEEVDKKCKEATDRVAGAFHVRDATLSFHSGGALDDNASNAFASPAANAAEGSGRVSLGIKLVQEFRPFNFAERVYAEAERIRRERAGLPALPPRERSLEIVIAHEYAHLLQYQNGLDWGLPHVELHADFMAGWAIGHVPMLSPFRWSGERDMEKLVLTEAQTMFSLGDENFNFNKTESHGPGTVRANIVKSGFLAGLANIDSVEAFAEAKRQVLQIRP